MDGAGGMETLRATSQDRRIARFQTQRSGIGGHIGATFVDDTDDAKRCAYALDVQTVRAIPF